MTDKRRDRNFDDLVGHFQKNIYDTPKGRIRLEILMRDLLESVPALTTGKPLRILDAGAGLGYMAGRLADMGHEIVLCDVSAEILAQAEKQLSLNHPGAVFTCINTAVQELAEHVSEQFDVILFHAVLEWLADPGQTLKMLTGFIKPAGYLSLMFYNKHGLVYRHLLNANFKILLDGEPRVGERLVPERPLLPGDVESWLSEAKMNVIARSGVRVIFDYLDQKQKQSLDMNELLEMEKRYSRISPYADLGRYQHFIAQKS